ncbi:fatty acyl-CoA reductase 2-like [Cochliomyia hominivorax]
MLISEFYKNKEIFITGGTGFLGKSFIEKLLRECPEVSKIYLLIRGKKNITPLERLKIFTNDEVFVRLHREQPKAFDKIIPIVGDSGELGLAISSDDLERMKNVNIIVHGAANVRFDNNLRGSILMNTRGTHELLKIALNFKNLLAFIHISTAYINPIEKCIEEKIYKSPVDWRSVIKICENYDEETLEILKPKFCLNFPNAYTFSKNLSEQVIAEFADKIPITILRPSIVVQSKEDPEPGYLDNLNGPMGLFVAIAIGIAQVTYCNGDVIMALIYVDYITKLTIVAGYSRGLKSLKSHNKNGLDIRNLTPGNLWKCNLKQNIQIFLRKLENDPFEKTLWAPNGMTTTNFYLFILSVFFINIPMAFVYDTLLVLTNKERMVMQLTRKYVYISKTLEKFSQNFFDFKNDGTWALLSEIPEEEKSIYATTKEEILNIDLDQSLEDLKNGIKKFIFKEPIKATTATKRRFKILIIIDKFIKLFITFFILGWLWKMIN